MKKKGSELEFISRIIGDGKSLADIPEKHVDFMKDEMFKLKRLSITNDTYLGFNFNVFVVKLKEK